MSVDATGAIAEAARRLRAGALVAFPTETVYGLGADALNADAVARVFAAKGRPAENPLIVHVSGEEMAERVVDSFGPAARRLAAALWPGPLTLVLEKAGEVPDAVTAGGPTVAVRCPDHPLALALIEAFGGPVVGPSANPSGYVSPTTADHVRSHFDPDNVLVLDGGACRAGIESTVVDLTGGGDGRPARVLRRGVVGADEVRRVLGDEVLDGAEAFLSGDGDGTVVASPGLLGPHYRPRARVIVVGRLHEVDAVLTQSTRGFVLSPPGTPVAVDPPHASATMPADASGYAAELYAALREADDSGADTVVVALPVDLGLRESGPGGEDAAVWLAIRERLRRASR